MGVSRALSDWKIRNPGAIPRWTKLLGFSCLRATQRWRALPDYCIFGAQKSGTTSLYSYLALHPEVKPSYVKEIHYYNEHFANGLKWYRSHFPIGPIERSKRDFITGEASTMYLHDKASPLRLRQDCPDIKLILVLRNPVDRAISHYHHRIRTGRETRDIKTVFDQALERASRGAFEPGTETDFLAYGRYASYLRHWLSIFPEEQILVLQAEKLFADPRSAFERVSEFLKIRFVEPEAERKFNAGTYTSKCDERLLKSLSDYFEPFNRELYKMGQVDFEW